MSNGRYVPLLAFAVAAATAPLAAQTHDTGQRTCLDAGGSAIPCGGTGHDGETRAGVEWPTPRFRDNANGTVLDRLTGLVWLKNANCFGTLDWADALARSDGLFDGATVGGGGSDCGLFDGSVLGDWRLPNVREMHSLISFEHTSPAVPNTAGNGQWSEGDPFSGVEVAFYSTSTSVPGVERAWTVSTFSGALATLLKSDTSQRAAWPVRRSQAAVAAPPGAAAITVDGVVESTAGGFRFPDGTMQASSGSVRTAETLATGQRTCWNVAGAVIPCAGTGMDGDILGGRPWTVPRFTDNGDGTVTDHLTGLIWLRDAFCFGELDWTAALATAAGLFDGAAVGKNGADCGLADGSAAGDWRLPSVLELQGLVTHEFEIPCIPNAAGSGQWSQGDPFLTVLIAWYWTSTSIPGTNQAWGVSTFWGYLNGFAKTALNTYLWPVREAS